MKHKKYSQKANQNIQTLVKNIEAYLIRQQNLEIIFSKIADGEHQICARSKHDIVLRVINQNKIIFIGIKPKDKDIEIRVGLGGWTARIATAAAGLFCPPILPLTVSAGVVGAKSQLEMQTDIWAIIDSYLK